MYDAVMKNSGCSDMACLRGLDNAAISAAADATKVRGYILTRSFFNTKILDFLTQYFWICLTRNFLTQIFLDFLNTKDF